MATYVGFYNRVTAWVRQSGVDAQYQSSLILNRSFEHMNKELKLQFKRDIELSSSCI